MKKFVPVIQRVFDDKYRDLLRHPFAHRGVHSEFPENSLPAFAKAVELNMGIELDIHLTTDNKVVVFHDDNLKRMTGVNEYVKLNSYEQLQKYKLQNTEYTIPLLSEVLSLVNGKVPILIELKTNNNMKRLVAELKKLLENYKGEIFLQSFNPFALSKCYKQMPQYLRGQLSSFFAKDRINILKKLPIKKLLFKRFSHIDFVSYNIENLPNKYVNHTNLPVLAWTVRTKEDYNKAKSTANNMIVDNVEALS